MSRTPYVVLFRAESAGNEAMENQHNVTGTATYLRHLRSEQKTWGRLRIPVFHCSNGRSRVERIVQFHRIESGRVERKIVRRLHPLRIETTRPTRRCERGSPNANVCHVPAILHRATWWYTLLMPTSKKRTLQVSARLSVAQIETVGQFNDYAYENRKRKTSPISFCVGPQESE